MWRSIRCGHGSSARLVTRDCPVCARLSGSTTALQPCRQFSAAFTEFIPMDAGMRVRRTELVGRLWAAIRRRESGKRDGATLKPKKLRRPADELDARQAESNALSP